MFDKKKKMLEKIQTLEVQNKKLYELAYFDNLTKTYNRNWLAESIYMSNEEFKLILVDVNGLKKINDQEGHLEGDKYLVTIANKLKEYGEVIRYGGDEFIVIVPLNFDETSIEDIRYCYGSSSKLKGEPFNKAFEDADKKLYYKKYKNKNK